MRFETESDLVKFYSSSLATLWERYLTISNLIITLSGGTALLFLNAIKPTEWQKSTNVRYALSAFILSGASLFLSLLWRFASQHFMEHETLGSQEETERYFQLCNITPVTITFRRRRIRGFYRIVFKCIPLPAVLLLVLSWAFIILFVASTS
jgi:hypothetical protein